VKKTTSTKNILCTLCDS